MDRRSHEVLDGERREDDLTEVERRQLHEYRAAVQAALDVLPNESAPDVAPAVLARIEAEAAAKRWGEASPAAEERGLGARIGRGLAWLWNPRPVQVALRPVHALAAAGAIAAVALFTQGTPWGSGGAEFGGAEFGGPDQPVASAPGAAAAPTESEGPRVLVHFRLDAPDAGSVRLAGDFTEWQPTLAMHEQLPGVWSVVVPLEPGVHDYAFVVDGEEWRPDPLAQQVDDGFGGTNSRLALLAPSAS